VKEFDDGSHACCSGKPEQTLKAGDSYETSPQTPRDGCSISGTKLIDTFVIEKGKPLASPAP